MPPAWNGRSVKVDHSPGNPAGGEQKAQKVNAPKKILGPEGPVFHMENRPFSIPGPGVHPRKSERTPEG
jgi:hypothetical protein